MTPLLLASWLSTQHWEWDKTPDTTAYRIYWGGSGQEWCNVNRVELPAATSCGAVGQCTNEESCCGDIPQPPFSPAFVIVTAVNAAGEGPTEHGPVVTCP